MGETLLIRADASALIGAGHAMRGLALAQAWMGAGGVAVWATAMDPGRLAAVYSAEGVRVERLVSEPGTEADAGETAMLAARLGASWVCQDGYHFSPGYGASLGRVRRLLLDDAGLPECDADVVLNQNVGALAQSYPGRSDRTRLLLGPRYALLRREFSAHRDPERPVPRCAMKVLVSLGGGASAREGAAILGAVSRGLDGIEVRLAPGFYSVPGGGDGPAAMALTMAWADIGVLGAGSACWEAACMGLPGVVLILAENQVPVAEGIARLGLALNLGFRDRVSLSTICDTLGRLQTDQALRLRMSARGRRLVDGRGAARVVRRLRTRVRLRPVKPEDSRALWTIANDPMTRAMSFSSAPIAWADHQRWFESKRRDWHCAFFVGSDSDDRVIGQVRYDFQGSEAVLSISIHPAHRGRGYGLDLLEESCDRVMQERNVTKLVAYTKPDNLASQKMFRQAGFCEEPIDPPPRLGARRLVLTTPEGLP
jgi:spore coat polysaccharide biosynthesis predicted glycosyltransferase SpsG/ribosomal protein S18 acetylase RimI-like enzyme